MPPPAADLTAADLTGADLTGADLTGGVSRSGTGSPPRGPWSPVRRTQARSLAGSKPQAGAVRQASRSTRPVARRPAV
ncbi:MAG: pentapeptide repeat-containing protein [Spirillospora sp.]